MLPFLASSVKVVKSDGSSVVISGDSSSGKSDEDHDADQDTDRSSTSSHTGTPSVHSRQAKSSDDAGIIVPCVAIFFVFSWLIIKALMSPFSQRASNRKGAVPAAPSQGLTDEEQAVLLKLQRTLVQMERRIESLETILIDQTRTNEKYGTKH